jgi:hypothetical protein
MNEDKMREELKDSLKTINDEPALFYRQLVESGVLGFIQSSPVSHYCFMGQVYPYLGRNPVSITCGCARYQTG